MAPYLKAHLSPVALISYAIAIASLLLRLVYSKSVLVGLFILSILLATWGTWICFQGWHRATSVGQKRGVVIVLFVFLGLSAWGGYMSLRDILR